MGGRNDADVDGLHLAAADADDRPLFEHAEQFDLHVETHVADFVEKERAALARFEMADAAGMGAGEAALFMPAELGFDEYAGNCAAQSDKRRVGEEWVRMGRARGWPAN